MDAKTRAEIYKLALESGWLTLDEVRQRENLPVGFSRGDDVTLVP